MNIPIFLLLQQSRNKPTSTNSNIKARPKNFDKICEKAKVSKINFCIHCTYYNQFCIGSPCGICRGYNPNTE